MTITQMKYFLSVVKHKSISKAAKENYVSPTSISMLLSNLEHLHNVKSFSKHGNTFELTKDGKILYEQLIKVINSYDEFEKIFSQIHHNSQTINIGVSHYLNTPLMHNFLSNLISHFHNYELNIYQFHSANICEQIQNNKLDLGIYIDIKDFTNFGKNISWTLLKKEEVILALSHHHNLAKKNTISLSELEKIPLFFLNNHEEKIDIHQKIFKSLGFSYQINYSTTKLHLISMLMAKKGASLFLKNFFTYGENFKALEISPPILGEIKLGYQKNNDSILKIVKFIEDNANNLV